MSGRLRPFEFLLVRGAESRRATFYALTENVALGYAKAWAKAHGWTLEGVSA